LDPEIVKRYAFILSAGAGALGVVTAIPAFLGGRVRVGGAIRAGLLALLGGLILFAIAGIVGLRLTPGSGLRGCALAAGCGALLAPLAALIGVFGSDPSDRAEVPPAPAWSLMSGIFLLGAGLGEMGWLARTYGVNALQQEQYWSLGVSAGLTWSVLVLRATRVWPGAEALCGNVSGAALTALTIGWTLQLATFHYPSPSLTPWFVIFLGVGLLAGWTLSLVACAMAGGGRGNRAATIGSSVVMTLSVAAVAGSAQMNIVREDNLLPAMAAGFLGALLVFTLIAGNESRTEEGATDSLSAAVSVLALVGLSWIGFKLMMGLGMAIVACGFLAAWPAATALGVAAPTRLGVPVPQRFTTLAGASLGLLAAFKVYQEAGDMALTGIDISDGNVLVSLAAGLILPVVLESVFGRRASVALDAPRMPLLDALARFVGVAAVALAALLCVGLFAGIEGVGVLALGLGLWGWMAAGAMAGTGREDGFATFRSLPAALLTASLAIVALPLKVHLADVTRVQKMEVAVAILAIAALIVLLGGLVGRRRSPSPAIEDSSTSIGGTP
jgi:hypothetical protein